MGTFRYEIVIYRHWKLITSSLKWPKTEIPSLYSISAYLKTRLAEIWENLKIQKLPSLKKISLDSLLNMYWAAWTWPPTFSSIKWHFDLFYSSLLQIFFFRLSKSDSSVFRVRVGWNKDETFCRLLSKYFPRWRRNWESTTGYKMATKA